VSRCWATINDETGQYDFNKKEQKIAALNRASVEDIQRLYRKIIFEEGRRLNIKLYSHQHHS
jgi:hypothetical protein